MASIGSGSATLVDITAGQTVSNATLTPGNGPIIGVGAISAGYGGSGESLTYSAEADFSFATAAPEEFYLNLLDSNHSFNGFDALRFQVTVDGTIEVLDLFTSLGVAGAFFSGFYGRTLDLGAWGAGKSDRGLVLLAHRERARRRVRLHLCRCGACRCDAGALDVGDDADRLRGSRLRGPCSPRRAPVGGAAAGARGLTIEQGEQGRQSGGPGALGPRRGRIMRGLT